MPSARREEASSALSMRSSHTLERFLVPYNLLRSQSIPLRVAVAQSMFFLSPVVPLDEREVSAISFHDRRNHSTTLLRTSSSTSCLCDNHFSPNVLESKRFDRKIGRSRSMVC